MNIRHLKWDSDFFGMRIARIDVDTNDSESDVREVLLENDCKYDLIYIFGGEHFNMTQDDRCKLVDAKVIYEGELDPELVNSDGVKIYKDKESNNQLYNLSYTSGKYSRFKTDDKFRSGDFERLYGKWIDNSVNETFADGVLCYYDDNNTERGMVTVKFTDGMCSIGLIAVEDGYQSKGIGKRLMAAVKREMLSRNVNLLEVATQKNNVKACSFYERCGLKVKEVSNIYHYWCRDV